MHSQTGAERVSATVGCCTSSCNIVGYSGGKAIDAQTIFAGMHYARAKGCSNLIAEQAVLVSSAIIASDSISIGRDLPFRAMSFL